MSVSRRASRKAKSSTLPGFQLGVEDYFPPHLIQALFALPCDAPEPPRKKLRIAPEAADTISVGRADLVIARIQPQSLPEPQENFSRVDVGRYLNLSIHEDHSCSQLSRLRFRFKPEPPVPAIQGVAVLPYGSFSAEFATIVRSAGETGSKICQQTGFTAVVDLNVSRQGGSLRLCLSLELQWQTRLSYHNALNAQSYAIIKNVIQTFMPSNDMTRSREGDWSPLDFYEAAFVPPKDAPDADSIEVPGLTASLYPFQKRTLQWLLNREGVEWAKSSNDGRGGIRELSRHNSRALPVTFRECKDLNGKTYYLSDVLHLATTDVLPFQKAEDYIKGGILCEEMGLGKTLEIIGLILLRRRSDSAMEETVDSHHLTSTGATLIVTPEPLRRQWMDELARHAPHLRITYYQGCKGDSHEDEVAAVQSLAGQDVVITTYSVLSAELHYAREPPQRSRRHERKYYRAKSPLMQLRWWRLCLDEAQMIESGVSGAAEVAKLVPRVNAWGITGTPVKNSVQDLRGLLIFLRYQPYSYATHPWKDLTTKHKPAFRRLFNQLALRHTKAMVRGEIKLPRQNRYVITMPFAAVEEQHYQSMFKEMAEECGLDMRGAPSSADWRLEDHVEKMSGWLNRLRQAALHPDVVMRRLLGGHAKNRPMRTVDEVLDAMIEQNERTIQSDQRAYFMALLTRGQLLENGPRVQEALAIWERVRSEISPVVEDCQKAVDGHAKEGSESGDEEEADSHSQEHQSKLSDLRRRLRSALEIQHRAVFFCANAYFQIRENTELTVPDSDEFKELQKLEDASYEEAKSIRRKILSETYRKTETLRVRLQDMAAAQSFVTIPELVCKPERGLESRDVLDQLEELYELLNVQADQLDSWREEVIQILLQPLLDEQDDLERTGEEFSETTQMQEKLMVYVTVLRAAIADRQDAISGQVNELIKYEMHVAVMNARGQLPPAPGLLLNLSEIRDRLKPDPLAVSMRRTISVLRQLRHRFGKGDAHSNDRQDLERRIADTQMQSVQKHSTEQSKVAIALESELELFTSTMNSRLEYYRQLQAVSDSVLPYEGEKSEATLRKMLEQEDKLLSKLASSQSKHRYLMNLKDAGSQSSEPRVCVICQTPFVAGVLTVCGHQFCKECMMLWFKAHRNCPVCKTHLKPSNLHDIVLKPRELRIHEETAGDVADHVLGDQSRSVQKPNTDVIYSSFSAEKLEAIMNIDLDGPSYTTKVDTLIRHILWLRESDPGSKSVVFSSFPYFLSILENAFSRYRIGYTSMARPEGIKKFKEDPGIEVFVLSAKAHSSGLNLVNANHVFLCEPLLNTAIELQAIARIDRIGQQQETTVWLYLVDGTVEESIYRLSARRRMEHMARVTKGKAQTATEQELDVANTLELEQAQLSKLISKDRNGGEVVDKGDVWECLFGQSAEEPIGVVSAAE